MTSVVHTPEPTVTLQEQAPRLLAHIAGYVGHKVVALGLRQGLIAELAAVEGGLTADELADRVSLDPFYTAVWCRGAVSSGICDVRADGPHGAGLEAHYLLAPHLDTLLLDSEHPAFAGGVFTVLEQPEVFDRFEAMLATGDRMWWDGCSEAWIAGVAGTGTPFYVRLAPAGLTHVPGLSERLAAGARIVDTACGSGLGVERLAQVYPACEIVGVDGDRHSIDVAEQRIREAGVGDRCRLVHTPLEEMELDEPAALVVNNISMHECRDIDRVTERVFAALEPGGWFVISDFPYPDSVDGLRSVPGRIMSGIQFFEAQIDDQLLPRTAYDELLTRHGFTELGHADLSPVHAITVGRRPF
jgi:SAM-dependent methyltransferase